MTTVLVTGGTGTLGRLVVPRLLAAGCRVKILSRTAQPERADVEFVRGDLESGAGVGAALAGVDTVLHLAGSQKNDGLKTRTLVDAATQAGVGHLVFISVVGADRVPVTSAIDRAQFGYFGEKRTAELAVMGSRIPWSMLRATQFHELGLLTLQLLSKGPIAFVFGGIRFQPIAAAEVAERMAELTLGRPAGLVPDLGGPQVLEMGALMRSYLAAAGRRRPVLAIPVAGGAGRAMKAGANLDESRAIGRQTWAEFLAEHAFDVTSAPAAR
ncbi:MAG: NAD(P)H-binding protein [Pseudolysinimonas sp.]